MDYSRFYTPPAIASFLIEQLQIEVPESAIDICCGSCNLLHAAKKKWKNIKVTGVDIIKKSTQSDKVLYLQEDGRKYAMNSNVKYSLVLANPPFDYIKFNEYDMLYKIHNLKNITKRLEIEMLLANLFLLEENGALLIIMPNTFIESERNKKLRKWLAENYYLQKIIKLPSDTFGSKKIKTYALIIRKSRENINCTRYLILSNKNEEYKFTKKCFIPKNNIINGDWLPRRFSINLENKFDFRRGNISSQYFTSEGVAVLHTAKKKENWEPSIRYIEDIEDKFVIAKTGDIIVSRVGRSAGEWCLYSGEDIPISDCLYRIKDPHGIIGKKLEGNKFNRELRGVSTPYITMNDFYSWYISLGQKQQVRR